MFFTPGEAKLKISGKVELARTKKLLKSSLIVTYKGRPVEGAIVKVGGVSLVYHGEGFYTCDKKNFDPDGMKELVITMNFEDRRDITSPPGEIELARTKTNDTKSGKYKFKMSKNSATGSEIILVIH